MWDVLKLALLHPKDYFGAIKSQQIVLKETIDEGNDIYSFIFTLTRPTLWKTGQHAVFRFPEETMAGRNWRPFSVASSPHEGTIRIGTICVNEPSPFKQKLRSLKPGDTLTMNGPFGEFYVSNKDTQLVGVAGGIGITPFRALLHDIAHGHLDTPITLIYAAKPGAHTYKDEFDRYLTMTDKIQIYYVSERQEVADTLDSLISEHGNTASYFISGAPRMIDGIRTTLEEHGITRIVNDPFKGY